MDIGLEMLVGKELIYSYNQLKMEIKELDRIQKIKDAKEKALEEVDLLRDNLNCMSKEDRAGVIKYIAMSNEALSDLTEYNYDNKLKNLLISNEFTFIELIVVIAWFAILGGLFGHLIAKLLKYKRVLKDYVDLYNPEHWLNGDKECGQPTVKDIETVLSGAKSYYNDLERLCKNSEKTSIDQIFSYAKKMGMKITEQNDTSFKATGSLMDNVQKISYTKAGYTAQNIKGLAQEIISVIDVANKAYTDLKANKETFKVDKQKVKAMKFMCKVAAEQLDFAVAFVVDAFERCTDIKL